MRYNFNLYLKICLSTICTLGKICSAVIVLRALWCSLIQTSGFIKEDRGLKPKYVPFHGVCVYIYLYYICDL